MDRYRGLVCMNRESNGKTNNTRILVVEDEELVRTFVISLLENHGYHVVAVDSAEQAMTAFLMHKNSIRLIFTDINLPGRSGCQLMEEIRALEPEVPFLIGRFHQEGILPGGKCAFISKPYRPERLMGAIQDQMSGMGI